MDLEAFVGVFVAFLSIVMSALMATIASSIIVGMLLLFQVVDMGTAGAIFSWMLALGSLIGLALFVMFGILDA
jgi:hypothetical protein